VQCHVINCCTEMTGIMPGEEGGLLRPPEIAYTTRVFRFAVAVCAYAFATRGLPMGMTSLP